MTHSSRRSRADNRARWRTLLELYDESTLSQRAFCLEHEVALSSFVRWRRRLADERAVTGESAADDRVSGGGFVAVRVRAATPSSNTSLCVTLPSGVRIENVDLAGVPLVTALVAAL